MKKLLSILLAVAMVFSLGVSALADGSTSTITSTTSSNTATKTVTANYTPSTTTDEAKWGASKDSLTIGSGTLTQAFAAAASSSDVKYIQLQKSVTATTNYTITGGSFTLDLNGNSITVNNYYSIGVNSATVTLADSVGTGKVEATGTNGAAVFVTNGGTVTVTGGSYEGGYALMTMPTDGSTETINIKGGTFTATGSYAVTVSTGSALTIEGGTFTGGSWASVATNGTTTIKGGSFAAGIFGHIRYYAGTLDLSNYSGTTAITELTVQNKTSSAVTVGNDTIKLPTNYAFYKSDDTSKTAVTELAVDTIYAIKSTSGDEGGSTTTDEAKWGASKDSLNLGSGTLADALDAAASSSDVKYIQLQTNATTTSSYFITGGKFTLDLNGKTISSAGYTITISNSSADVIFTDSGSGGKVETTASDCAAITVRSGKLTINSGSYGETKLDFAGSEATDADVTINGGSFTKSNGYAVTNNGGTLTITGGSFTGYLADIYLHGTNGKTTIKGGTFTAANGKSVVYYKGKIDLADCSATTLTALTVANHTGNTVTVGNDTIKLPTNYAFYKSDDTSKTAVTELAVDTIYAIKSTSGDEGGTTTTDEAKWGASATDLSIGSGTLAAAFAAAASNSDIKYIQLQTSVTLTGTGYSITGGKFTLDLNGKTISSNYYTITIGDDEENDNSGIEVTFTGSASGSKVETTGSAHSAIVVKCGKVTFTSGSYGEVNMNASGREVPYAEVTINDGSFTSTEYPVFNVGGTLTITGGSFSGSLGDILAAGTTTIKGGTFTAGIIYDGGKLDLASYPTTAITNLTVTNWSGSAVTVGDTTVKLPTGYAFYNSTDADKAAVTELAANTRYAIKSTSGSTTDTATITGVTVTIDSTEYTSANATATDPAKITPDTTSITYTIQGTNLDKLPDTFGLKPASGVSSQKDVFSISSDGKSATRSIDSTTINAWMNGMTTAFELTYTLDGSNYVGTGVYYVYDSGTPKATITGVSVKVGDTTYTTGTVTLTPTSGDVTIIVTGTNLSVAGGADAVVTNVPGHSYKLSDGGWTFNEERTTATRTFDISEFKGCTTAYQIQYSNTGNVASGYTGTGIHILYQAETTSVDITWGSLSFTYSDEQVSGADKGWSCDEGANTVKVENKGTASIKADVTFTKSSDATNLTDVTGTFDKSTATLAASGSETFTLTLSGKPGGALTNATIGTVTVTIGKAS